MAFAAHVADEALTDFLPLYNTTVSALRERLPFLPFPTFTFSSWLTFLVVALAVLFCLSPFAFRGASWMRLLSYAFGIIMLGNGLGHIAGSFLLGRTMPGVYSSPLLLAGSIYLLMSLYRSR
jgi:hypothetical protein